MNKKNHIVKKSNNLIGAHYKLNINEQKIIYKLISLIHIDDNDFKNYDLKVVDLISFLDIKNNRIYKDIKGYVNNLMKEILVFEEEGKEVHIQWLSLAEYKDNGVITFNFHPRLKPFLLNLKSQFTRFEIENIRKFKSSYTPRIYEILKQFEKVGYREITVDELRSILQLKNAYKNYNDFKKKVIIITQEEIKKYSDLTFEFKEIKNGNKVVAIAFYINSKKMDKINCVDMEVKNKENNQQLSIMDLTNKKVQGIKNKIQETIDDEIKEKKIIEWIEKNKEEDVDYYLENWQLWDWKTKTTKAGFFIDLVDNKRPIPSGKKGIKVNLEKPPQATNYEQRKYDDEYFYDLYDNVTFIK